MRPAASLRRLTAITLHPRRFMRSRGHGVHSPFAFRFICSVIGERRCGYYAYGRLERLAVESRGQVTAADLKLLFRMFCALKPLSFRAVGAGSRQAEACVRLAQSNVAIVPANGSGYPDGGATLWWVGGEVDPEAEVRLCRDLAAGPAYALIIGSSGLGRMASEALSAGMTFTSGRKTIVVGLSHLPRQDYSVIF